MIFTEAIYFLLLLPAVAVFHLLPGRWRSAWLFALGFAFYAYYAPGFLLLLSAEAVVVYLLALRAVPAPAAPPAPTAPPARRPGDHALAAGLALTIGLLAYFKYRNFALAPLGLAWSWATTGQAHLLAFEDLVIPLAISFFTFEFVHYLVDAARGHLPAHRFVDFLAFAMFFPTMIAGPIKRFQEFFPQVTAARFSGDDASAGITRILVGLVKKVAIADTMNLWVARFDSVPTIQGTSTTGLVIGILAYALKIYMDFSGYSDIAIGSARLFGIRVPENFDWPYLRPNIAEFWKHWHISLYRWIVDYIFVPLGGSRGSTARICANTMIAMGASGLWHGAGWNFVLWGLYHGMLLVGYRLHRTFLKPFLRQPAWLAPLTHLASVALTFSLVCLGWVLFMMPLELAVATFARLLGRIA